MNFASDNWAGATEAVMAAVNRANGGFAPAYGGDALTAEVTETFREIFEAKVDVFFVATGTAANALSMAAAARPGGVIFCTGEAHIQNDEFGASEFFTGGMKLVPVASRGALMQPGALEASIGRFGNGRSGPPTALSLTNATECGTVYPIEQARALSAIAKARDMMVHMDGARFGNAVAALGASPAEITWKSGVDIMSFGGTKNGCLGAEAIVVFAPEKFPYLGALRQRAGHTMSKARFVAAQFAGYFADGGWLETAAHANAMARRLSTGIRKSNGARLGWESTANEVFPVLSNAVATRVREAGAMFHPWDSPEVAVGADEQLVRLVTSWATGPDEVDRFLALL